jgi:hypothetical protein
MGIVLFLQLVDSNNDQVLPKEYAYRVSDPVEGSGLMRGHWLEKEDGENGEEGMEIVGMVYVAPVPVATPPKAKASAKAKAQSSTPQPAQGKRMRKKTKPAQRIEADAERIASSEEDDDESEEALPKKKKRKKISKEKKMEQLLACEEGEEEEEEKEEEEEGEEEEEEEGDEEEEDEEAPKKKKRMKKAKNKKKKKKEELAKNKKKKKKKKKEELFDEEEEAEEVEEKEGLAEEGNDSEKDFEQDPIVDPEGHPDEPPGLRLAEAGGDGEGFKPGNLVTVTGLVSREDLNGKGFKVLEVDNNAHVGRARVEELPCTTRHGEIWIKIGNLQALGLRDSMAFFKFEMIIGNTEYKMRGTKQALRDPIMTVTYFDEDRNNKSLGSAGCKKDSDPVELWQTLLKVMNELKVNFDSHNISPTKDAFYATRDRLVFVL